MGIHDDPDSSSATNMLDTALNATAIVAFSAAMVAGGALVMPLGLLGGACMGGSIVAGLSGKRDAGCWTRCEENEAISAVSPVIPLPQQTRQWVEAVTKTVQPPSRTR